MKTNPTNSIIEPDSIKFSLEFTDPDYNKVVKTMTHTDCVNCAYSYLRNRCNVVLPEFFTHNSELADVIGFKNEVSTLIECKVSRSDFLSDKKKHFRIHPEKGMGDYRFYCCPKGLLNKEEMPEGWGLLWVYPSGQVRRIKESFLRNDGDMGYHHGYHPKNQEAEFHLLYYYARRANYAGVHKTIIEYRGYDV